MSGDNRGGEGNLSGSVGGSKAATHDDIGGGSNAAASSVTPLDDDYVKVRGLRPHQFLRLWRNKTGLQHLTREQVSDHLHRINACSDALFSDFTISPDQYKQSILDAETKSYEILCNGGTSENWPYPIKKKKY